MYVYFQIINSIIMYLCRLEKLEQLAARFDRKVIYVLNCLNAILVFVTVSVYVDVFIIDTKLCPCVCILLCTHILSPQAILRHTWLSDNMANVAEDNFGTDVYATEAAIKKHEALETDVKVCK